MSKLNKSSLLSIWYGFRNFKNLPKRQNSYKILRNKEFHIVKNRKYYGYQCGLASLVYTFFDKKSPSGSFLIEIMLKQKLGKELHKPIIRELKNKKNNHHLLAVVGVLILI